MKSCSAATRTHRSFWAGGGNTEDTEVTEEAGGKESRIGLSLESCSIAIRTDHFFAEEMGADRRVCPPVNLRIILRNFLADYPLDSSQITSLLSRPLRLTLFA